MVTRGRSGKSTGVSTRAGGTRRYRGKVAAGSVVVVAFLAAACSSSSNNSSSTTTAASNTSTSTTAPVNPLAQFEHYPSAPVSLTETGSSLLYPLFNIWSAAFQQQWPNFKITAASTGSGTGITDATNGIVTIGASDAYLSNTQAQASPNLMNIPLSISAQMVNYNLPGVTNLKLNGQVLSKIYQGTVTTWNDPAIAALNAGVNLPSTTIVPVHRSDGSGDTFLFTSYLSDADPTGWGTKVGPGTTVSFPAVPGALGAQGNGGMVTSCQSTPGCVAYIGISYQSKTQASGLGTAALANKAGNFEMPTQAAITSEAASFAATTPANGTVSLIFGPASDGYPIVNYEYAIVSKTQPDANTAQGLQSFLAWAMDPTLGSTAANLGQVNFQPLPTSAIQIAANMIKQIT